MSPTKRKIVNEARERIWIALAKAAIRKRDLIITVLRDEIKDRERTIKQTRKETAKEIFDEIDVLLQKEIHWDYDTWDTFLPNLKELRRKFE